MNEAAVGEALLNETMDGILDSMVEHVVCELGIRTRVIKDPQFLIDLSAQNRRVDGTVSESVWDLLRLSGRVSLYRVVRAYQDTLAFKGFFIQSKILGESDSDWLVKQMSNSITQLGNQTRWVLKAIDDSSR